MPVDPSKGRTGRPLRQWADRLRSLYTSTLYELLNQGFGFVDINPSTFLQFDNSRPESTAAKSPVAGPAVGTSPQSAACSR